MGLEVYFLPSFFQSGNVSDLGDIFMMTSRTMKAEFSGRGVLRVE